VTRDEVVFAPPIEISPFTVAVPAFMLHDVVALAVG
jgi:hypothetical protein